VPLAATAAAGEVAAENVCALVLLRTLVLGLWIDDDDRRGSEKKKNTHDCAKPALPTGGGGFWKHDFFVGPAIITGRSESAHTASLPEVYFHESCLRCVALQHMSYTAAMSCMRQRHLEPKEELTATHQRKAHSLYGVASSQLVRSWVSPRIGRLCVAVSVACAPPRR
jgi:hypothetical protein